MAISTGDMLPEANFIKIGENGPEAVSLASLTEGKKTVIFAVPGAYTPTCTSAHMPSFVRNMDALKAKGVDEVVCVSVNDPFVMKSWGAETGGTDAGIQSLADADGAFTAAIGLDFTAPPAGLLGRSKRYAMVVENGKVTALQVEESPGECSISAAEGILDVL